MDKNWTKIRPIGQKPEIIRLYRRFEIGQKLDKLDGIRVPPLNNMF